MGSKLPLTVLLTFSAIFLALLQLYPKSSEADPLLSVNSSDKEIEQILIKLDKELNSLPLDSEGGVDQQNLPPTLKKLFSDFSTVMDNAQKRSYSSKKENIFEDTENGPVALHLRGDQGIKIEEVKFGYPDITSKEKVEEAQKIFDKTVDDLIQKFSNPVSFKKCTEAKTEKEEIALEEAPDDGVTIFDILFIDQNDIPQDADAMLGSMPLLFPISQKEANPLAFAAEGLNIPCLPFRVRATKGFVIKDQGLNAVKNYDKGNYTEGELHEEMKKRFGG